MAKSGRHEVKYYRVRGENLRPKEIADKYDLPLTTVLSRIRDGRHGERLITPVKAKTDTREFFQ